MMFTASSSYHDPGTLELATPFDRAFVDAIKIKIPPSHRQWNSESKTWIVLTPYDSVALGILRCCFPDAETGPKPSARPVFFESGGCQCDADHRALYVCQNAPEPVIRAAYRALAKISHPHAGGDQERMRSINSAYERLTSEVGS